MLVEDVQGFRLSPQQRRTWSLWRGDGPAYGVHCAVSLEGMLDEDLLTRALQRVIDRHEILRTEFRSLPGMHFPVQVIGEAGSPRWSVREGNGDRDEDLLRNAARTAGDGSAVRAQLVRFGADRHVLTLSLSPLCADAVSVDNLVRDLAWSYAEVAGQQRDQDEPAVQYVQFSEWQNTLLEDEEATGGREFWKKQAAEGTADLRLPFELARTDRSRFEPGVVRRTLEPGVTKQLREVAKRSDSTVDTVLLTAWQILLWRVTGQRSFSVATLYDGRCHEAFVEALGSFARWLPVRSRLRPGQSFQQAVAEAGQARDGAFEWGEFFSWTQEAEAGEYLAAGFLYESWPKEEEANGVSFRLLGKDVCSERFKLKLACFQRSGELILETHYDAARLLAEDVERLTDQLTRCLECVAANPEAAVEELEILGDAERNRLLKDFNRTAREYPAHACIHHLFEAQAAKTPEAPAVFFEGRSLSYAELNQRANQLARYLRKLGVRPETLVAICLDRSLDFIVALLGVLKAGGAYVPLEASQPQQRLAFMLEDIAAPVALAQESLVERLSHYQGRIVQIDKDGDAIALESREDLGDGAGGGNLVYVIFTSGSTGRPKGVAVEHRQLVNYTLGVTERLELPAGATFANVSTFAADLGNTAIFPALCTGGCLHVISQERTADAAGMAEYFRQYKIDCLKIVPSHFEALQALPAPDQVHPRRRLVLGGEASRPAWIEELQGRAGDCVLFNHYGPSETTVGVLTYRAEPGRADERCSTLPLGRPIPNVQVYLLDPSFRPVPVWTAGELYIGGANVSRGYLNRPDLTADRFVPDPFGCGPGARLYRTGDLARCLPDGDIEFLGRVDDQVKFHGFRVELNEIRSALNGLPQVRDSVIVMAKDGNGRDVLIAYYVSRHELEVSQLREGLRKSILEETMPNLFVHLKKLPLTLNGKINYSALPSLEEARKMVKRVFVAPRNPTEEVMARIWAEVLGLEQVSIQDNFFELGGHSLLATRVIARQREAFQVEIPLRSLFEAPTIASLAEVIERSRSQAAGSEMGAGPIQSEATSIDTQLEDLDLLSDEQAAGLLKGPGAIK